MSEPEQNKRSDGLTPKDHERIFSERDYERAVQSVARDKERGIFRLGGWDDPVFHISYEQD